MNLLAEQLKIVADRAFEDVDLAYLLSVKFKLPKDSFENIKVVKLSLDSRKKPMLFYVANIAFGVNDKKTYLKLLKNGKNKITEYKSINYNFPVAKDAFRDADFLRPVIVGMGPAGLMSAYYLALAGLKPLVIERGKKVEDRIRDVEQFWLTGHLNTSSNIQFGEGGAGTFSDGKLQTGVKDKYGRISEILKVFVENGAPNDILYLSKPHIGTNKLTKMVKNIRKRIIDMGGEIRFETVFKRTVINDDKLTGVVIEHAGITEEIKTNHLILAIGHSSRDTFVSLYEDGLAMENKAFAVGYRVIHDVKLINESQYGKDYPDFLPAADYKLTYNDSLTGHGVYSFCMCPGGYVVNASSEEGKLVVNGMSDYERDAASSNSAIVINVDSDVYGEELFDGMKFQQQLEQKAYQCALGSIPIQCFKDFKNDSISSVDSIGTPCIKGKTEPGYVNRILPDQLNQVIIRAFDYFGHVINGFDNDNTIFAGIETRTSSPIKIPRDDESFMCNIEGVYPCGEGAGYAGGITSAALDGLKVAEKVALSYNLLDF